MFGYGCYGNGGSSSSLSGLSPLAPPFTVDRSVPKVNSAPLVDFTESPPYVPDMNSTAQNWFPSHYPSSGNNYNAEFESINSSNGFNHLGPESVHVPTTHLAAINHVAEGGIADSVEYLCSGGITTSTVEAQPYFPSYVLPAVHDDNPLEILSQHGYDLLPTSQVSALKGSYHNNYTQNLTGSEYTLRWDDFWNGMGEWEQGKQREIDGLSKEMNAARSSSVHKNYMNQGAYAYKGLSAWKGVPHSTNIPGRNEQFGCASTEQLDDKSFLGKKSKFMPVDHSRTSHLGAKVPETQESSLKFFPNSSNYQVPYNSSYGDELVQEDVSFHENVAGKKPSPALVIRQPTVGTSSLSMNTGAMEKVSTDESITVTMFSPAPVITSSSSQITGVMKKVNIDSDTDLDFVGNNLSSVKESCPLSGDRIRFDASQLSNHLDKKDQIIMESPAINNEELSENKTVSNNALDHIFNQNFEVQFSCIPDAYSVALGGHEASSSPETFTENHYNTAVDSPCWRGASLSYFSPTEVSGDVAPQVMKSMESCNGLNLQGTQIFPHINDDIVKLSYPKPGENTMYPESGLPENGSGPHSKRLSVNNILFREQGNYGIDEPKKECSLPNKSVCNSEFGTSDILQNRLQEGKFTSEQKGAPGTGSVETGLEDNDASEDGSSNVSSVDGRTKLSISLGAEFAPQIDVQTLVKTMHNLSELLLFNCSNKMCELKEEDREVLKKLTSNLVTCLLNNVERKPQIEDLKFHPRGTSQFLGEVAELHKGLSVERPHISKVAAVNVQGDQHLDKENMRHIVSVKKDEKFSDFYSEKTDVSMLKDDKMTQAFKKILSENFLEEEENLPQTLLYKNLWLEAEAALCSINYKNRFNRMKIEMENCKSVVGKETAKDAEKLSSSRVSTDINTAENFAPEVKGVPPKDISVQNSPFISTSGHADDVMARFNILKGRDSNSNSINTMVASSKVSSDSSDVEEFETEAKNYPVPDISIKDSFISSTTSNADNFEDSVMARFRILKSRVDNSRSKEMEGEQLPYVDIGVSANKFHWPIIRDKSEETSLDVKMDTLQHHNPKHFANRPTVKEFHRSVQDDPVMQSRRTDKPDNLLPGGGYDSSTSDWEHVLKEELSG